MAALESLILNQNAKIEQIKIGQDDFHTKLRDLEAQIGANKSTIEFNQDILNSKYESLRAVINSKDEKISNAVNMTIEVGHRLSETVKKQSESERKLKELSLFSIKTAPMKYLN